jgi:mRNA-degrading endonuclease RelE of RelBE toxin-antitoxin system
LSAFLFEFRHFCSSQNLFHFRLLQPLTYPKHLTGIFGLYYLPKKGYILNMAYKVLIKKSVIKGIAKIPPNIQKKFRALVEVLQASGTRGATGWSNFSKLDGNKYHCHLTYHYVVCWTDEKGTLTIEVYYVGSRESAPY